MSQSLFTKLLGFDDDEDAQAFLDHFWKDKVPAISRDLDAVNIGTMKIAAAHYRAGMMYVVNAVKMP